MSPRVHTRCVETPAGPSWVVEVGDEEFSCKSEQEARELAADIRADLSSQYVRYEE